MNIKEALDLTADIRKAQKNTKTPVGACYSMQNEYLKDEGYVTIGPCLPDGRFALYAQSETKEIPEEWCGFPVVDNSTFIV